MTEITTKCPECKIYTAFTDDQERFQNGRAIFSHRSHVLIYDFLEEDTSVIRQIENIMDFISKSFIRICSVVNTFIEHKKNSIIVCDLDYYKEFANKIILRLYQKGNRTVHVTRTDNYICLEIDKINLFLVNPSVAIEFVKNIDITNLTFILNDENSTQKCTDLFLKSRNMQNAKYVIIAFKMGKDGNYPIDFHDILSEHRKGNIDMINYANPNATKEVMRKSVLNVIGDHSLIQKADIEASKDVNFILVENKLVDI